MRNLLGVMIATLCLAMIPSTAHAAKATKATKASKATQPTKERLVLMPLRVPEADKNLQGMMEAALVEGLQQKYTVLWGEEVEKKAREIFRKENLKHECNEERCMQGIAEAFQSELLATANITKQDGGYFLSLTIQNLYDHIVIYTKSIPCEGCTAFKVVDKLKELSAAAAPVAVDPAIEEPQPKINLNDPDGVLWAEAQKGNTVDDYQVYLDTYPKGKYTPFAKARIKKLKEAAQAATGQQEQLSWDAAQKDSSEASYSLYLNAYPTGRFAGLAKVRLNKLKNDIAAKEEAAQWQTVQSSEDSEVVQGYLDEYPTSSHLAAAQDKLAAIKKAEASGPKAGTIIRDCPDCPELVVIPKGSFGMGSRNGSADDKPAHSVTIAKPFAMGKTEVTQGQWKAVMGNNPSRFSNCGDNCPVEQVSWDDAQAFIHKLNAKTGKKYRLPTEAEWEYACRAGDRHEYCSSENIDSVAWYDKNSDNKTHPAGQKQANAFGLYDMSGNVAELVEDSYHVNYNGAPSDGTEWLGDGAKRVLRGGSWFDIPMFARAAQRMSVEAAFRYDKFGFRLARMLP